MLGEQIMYYDEETFRKKCEIRRQKEQEFAAEILRLVREAQKEQSLMIAPLNSTPAKLAEFKFLGDDSK